MRYCVLFLVFVFLSIADVANAQQPARDSLQLPAFKEYQFQLPEKVREIQWIEYEKSRVPMHGKLSPDSSSVILRNYQRGEPVRVKVLLHDGTVKEYVKSPCFIDPVIQVL